MILFVIVVGVRRFYLDREVWVKVTATLRKYVFFWKGTTRPPEAEESLASLLARRDQVRGARTAAGTDARPELFKPEHQPLPTAPFGAPESKTVEEGSPTADSQSPAAEEKPATTSRLLEAKRRAQKRRDG